MSTTNTAMACQSDTAGIVENLVEIWQHCQSDISKSRGDGPFTSQPVGCIGGWLCSPLQHVVEGKWSRSAVIFLSRFTWWPKAAASIALRGRRHIMSTLCYCTEGWKRELFSYWPNGHLYSAYQCRWQTKRTGPVKSLKQDLELFLNHSSTERRIQKNLKDLSWSGELV